MSHAQILPKFTFPTKLQSTVLSKTRQYSIESGDPSCLMTAKALPRAVTAKLPYSFLLLVEFAMSEGCPLRVVQSFINPDQVLTRMPLLVRDKSSIQDSRPVETLE